LGGQSPKKPSNGSDAATNGNADKPGNLILIICCMLLMAIIYL